MKIKKNIIGIVCTLWITSCLHALPFFDRSIFDINFRSHIQRVKKHEILAIPVISLPGDGRNALGHVVNPLQYLDPTQDALAMLKGFPAGSIESNIAQQINVDDDNGIRGHLRLTGQYLYETAVVSYSYHFAPEWFLRFRIPITHVSISQVKWVDLTENVTYDDRLTRELVTNNFAQNVATWGDLNIGPWSGSGFGDLFIYPHWQRVFLQEKEWLKEVGINARLGFLAPTGKKHNNQFAFSYAFGGDGAWAVSFGAGIDLKFKDLCRVGLDAAFEHAFAHTSVTRIMTDTAQTDFLFLQKARVTREYGITQMYNIFIEPQLLDTVAFRCAYQHIKHNKDRLFVLDNNFSSLIANQAANLKEWSNHSFLLQLRYDNKGKRGVISPIITLFAQIPFNGKRSINAPTLGFNFVLHF